MRKILFLLITLISPVCFAQVNNSVKFNLSENGVFLSQDGKEYIVLEYPNESQNDLYNKYLVAITGLYISPKDVISKVDGQMISLRGYKSGAFTNTLLGVFSYTYDIEYVIKFQAKDGKVKIDSPEIVKIRQSFGNSKDEYGISEFIKSKKLFEKELPEITGNDKKDEKSRKRADKKNKEREEYVSQLNRAVNSLINNIINETNKNQSEDW